MDEYPDHLAPIIDEDRLSKEPFQTWWERVGAQGFPNIPRNVARQWIWRHWGHSPYQWLPSSGARFDLTCWSNADLRTLQMWRTSHDKEREWGFTLLGRYRQGPPEQRYRLPGVMIRRGYWPAPIIVLAHDGRFCTGQFSDMATGNILVEGHRRTAVALALAAENRLSPVLPVWVLSYP